MSDVTATVRVDDIKAVIDMALVGDRACSGHLDDEEVDTLRRLAVAAGLDPMDATPYNYACKYIGSHDWGPWDDWKLVGHSRDEIYRYRHCKRCRHWDRESMRVPAKGEGGT